MPRTGKTVLSTTEWEAAEHIEGLKGIPDTVECKAAGPMSLAMIFFGRQLCDMKEVVAANRIAIDELPDELLTMLDARPKEVPEDPSSGDTLVKWSKRLGLPPIYIAVGYLVAKAHGWL